MKIKNSIIIIIFLIFLFYISSVSASENFTCDNLTSTDNFIVNQEYNIDSPHSNDSYDLLKSNVDENESLNAGVSDLIYVNVSSHNNPRDYSITGKDWNNAYGTDQGLHVALMYINKNGKVIVADGSYNTPPNYENVLLNRYMTPFTIEGYGNNVVFSFDSEYNLDVGSANGYGAEHDGKYAFNLTITHKNIIFDCDVKVGSRNFEFINCTFNKNVKISRDYQSDDICTVTFENCTFINSKKSIVPSNNTKIIFSPLTPIDSKINVSSNNNVIIVTLTDDEGNPIKEAKVNYNTSSGEKGSKITDNNGKFNINDLIGEFKININYDGNDSYNQVNISTNFNFKKSTENNESLNIDIKKNTASQLIKKVTKITASKKTFKSKTKTKKYTITLKSEKTFVKKVKVTLNIGKKIYKATTNTKGKATFKITKLSKKGKYTAIIRFIGNKNYKACSKKVKITIKK